MSKEKENNDFPHSIAFWLRWEIHERKPNGQLAGCPKDYKQYQGALHCENRKEAKEIIQSIIDKFTEDLKKCQEQLQTKTTQV